MTISLISQVGLWCIVLVLCAAVLLLYRHFGRQLLIRQRLQDGQGPEVDEVARVSLETVNGAKYSLSGGSKAHLVVFTSPKCSACHSMQPILAKLAMAGGNADIMIVHRGDIRSTRKYAEQISASVVAVSDEEGELFRFWRITSTPFCVVTDSEGVVVGKGGGQTKRRVVSLFEMATKASAGMHRKGGQSTRAQGETLEQ